MSPALQTIQALVAPVVMISANGLLCLALYNRLAAVMTRARAFHKELFDLSMRLAKVSPDNCQATEVRHLNRRIHALDELGHNMIGRARLLRNSLYCLLLSVLCMIGCSMALGLSPLCPSINWVALALFYVGAAVMMLGIVAAIIELYNILGPLLLEHDTLEGKDEG